MVDSMEFVAWAAVVAASNSIGLVLNYFLCLATSNKCGNIVIVVIDLP